jgi:hypothetical protein
LIYRNNISFNKFVPPPKDLFTDKKEIDASIRGEFSTTEAALQSMFDVLQYMSTIIFSNPRMFKYPVLMSCVSVGVALCVYASFVRKRRGHLVHFYEKVLDRDVLCHTIQENEP